MNFKRLMLEELDRFLGREKASSLVLGAFDNCYNVDFDDYFSVYAKFVCTENEINPWQACWEYIKEAFDGDEQATWGYFSKANNSDYLLLFIDHMLDEDEEEIHKFLRQHMEEAQVAEFLENGDFVTGIEYKPIGQQPKEEGDNR